MKKIVLASALAFASFAVNAQTPSTTPSTAERSEDVANLYITMNLHNWIDIDNENTSLLSTEPNSWADLNNGWTVGNAPFNLSASRKCKVAVSSTSARDQGAGHTASDVAGWSFGANYLSLEAGSSSASNIGVTVTGPGFSDSWIQRNSLSAANQDCYTSNQGMYVRRLNPSIGAFMHSAAGTYYTLNLNGGTYKATVTFTATLN